MELSFDSIDLPTLTKLKLADFLFEKIGLINERLGNLLMPSLKVLFTNSLRVEMSRSQGSETLKCETSRLVLAATQGLVKA